MILNPGEKVHVIHRQFFEGDARRHFVGQVENCEGDLARVNGFIFAMDAKLNQFVRRDPRRTRLISLSCGTVIINLLPEKVQIEKIKYKYRPAGDVLVTDGTDWHL